MLEVDRNGKSSHVGVKGEFLGKPVPLDGNRKNLEKETGPNESGRESAGSSVTHKQGHISKYVRMCLLRLYL